MYSEITESLLEAIAHIESERVKLEREKSEKKEVMETLKVRFPSSINSGCEMISEEFDNWNKSDVARAAMYLGLKQIKEVLDRDPNKANGLMHVIKLRTDLLK